MARGFRVDHKAKFTVEVYSMTSRLSECMLLSFRNVPLLPVDNQLHPMPIRRSVCGFIKGHLIQALQQNPAIRFGPCAFRLQQCRPQRFYTKEKHVVES